MTSYDKGDQVRLTITFTDLDGVQANPTTVTLYVRDPANVITQYTGAQLTNTAAGVYTFDLSLPVAGIYTYRWAGTGALQAATPDTSFRVIGSALA